MAARAGIAAAGLTVLMSAGVVPLAPGGLVSAGAAVLPRNTTYTTSTTLHRTSKVVTVPTVEAYETQVWALLDTNVLGWEIPVYEQTFALGPGSAEVQASFAVAQNALAAWASSLAAQNQRVLLNFTSNGMSFLPLEDRSSTTVRPQAYIERSVTTTHTLGPATIFIGPGRSQPYFVPAGNDNYNTNTDSAISTTLFVQPIITHVTRYTLRAYARYGDPPPHCPFICL